jgi:hypothetical protein
MHLSNAALSVLALVALGLSLLAMLLAFGSARRSRRARPNETVPADEQLEVVAEAQGRSIQRLEGAVRQLAGGEKALGEVLRSTIQHVGLVRFDAFEDMGGRLSFSAALLDDHGDGIVITSINGRQDTRCYAKLVRAGTSIHNLSGEEEQAIREAMGGPREVVPVDGVRGLT